MSWTLYWIFWYLNLRFFFVMMSALHWVYFTLKVFFFKKTTIECWILLIFTFSLFIYFCFNCTRLWICLAVDCLFVLFHTLGKLCTFLENCLWLVLKLKKVVLSIYGSKFLPSWSIRELVRVDKNGLLFSSSSELADELLVSND